MKNNPTISVCLITYAQEKYIQQSILGVFAQNVNFSIELIISNDRSPDGTHDKIEEILEKCPEHITVKYYNHKENLGMMRNFQFALNQCTGRYIAYFEGDDYWDYPYKLQKQIDFLEQNPDFAICCHNIRFLEQNQIIEQIYLDKMNIKEISTLEDLANFNLIATLSAVFRNVENKLPNWILDSPIGDLPLFMMVAKTGKIKYINEKWAVYRSNIGEWSKMGNKRNEKMILQYDLLIKEFQSDPSVAKNLVSTRNRYIKEFLKNKEISLSNALFHPLSKKLSTKDFCIVLYKKISKKS